MMFLALLRHEAPAQLPSGSYISQGGLDQTALCQEYTHMTMIVQ